MPSNKSAKAPTTTRISPELKTLCVSTGTRASDWKEFAKLPSKCGMDRWFAHIPTGQMAYVNNDRDLILCSHDILPMPPALPARPRSNKSNPPPILPEEEQAAISITRAQAHLNRAEHAFTRSRNWRRQFRHHTAAAYANLRTAVDLLKLNTEH